MSDLIPPSPVLTISANEGNCFQATMNLRVIAQHEGVWMVISPIRMQQLWLDHQTNVGEWRDIPVVYGDIPNPSPM